MTGSATSSEVWSKYNALLNETIATNHVEYCDAMLKAVDKPGSIMHRVAGDMPGYRDNVLEMKRQADEWLEGFEAEVRHWTGEDKA